MKKTTQLTNEILLKVVITNKIFADIIVEFKVNKNNMVDKIADIVTTGISNVEQTVFYPAHRIYEIQMIYPNDKK